MFEPQFVPAYFNPLKHKPTVYSGSRQRKRFSLGYRADTHNTVGQSRTPSIRDPAANRS